MAKKQDPLENILGRVEDLDPASLRNLINRLVRERHLLHGVFKVLREGVIVIAADGTIEYANDAAPGMLGFSHKEVGTLNLWKAVPDLSRTLRINRSGQLYEASSLSREIELTYPERRIVRLYIVPFSDDDEDAAPILRYAIILSDITQEKTRTRQEIEDERVRSILDLTAGVAHELGNPLNSLTIHLQVMQRMLDREASSPQNDKLSKSMRICSGEVERLDSIIRNFLEAVRPTEPDFSDLTLIEPLEESIQFLGPEFNSAGVQIDLTLETSVPLIRGDRNQIKQVFFNLLKNARQAMKEGGVVRIRFSADDDFVFVHIGDTGEGIAEEDLKKVFQPYYTTKKDGSGLGMMIVERIMRDHGGRIGIDSRKGIGTLVTLQFPQKNRRVRMLGD